MELTDYINSHISPEPELLKDVYRSTFLNHLYPRMCTDHAQGRFLTMITSLIAPMHILELGTFTGYSALCMAEGMPAGAHLHTIEIDDEMEDELLATFVRSPRAADIHLHIGDALDIVPTLCERWDMVLIDANKRLYPEYLEIILPRMKAGGFILADNTLWGGKPANPADNDPQTEGIRRFNNIVAANPHLEKCIIPFSDGLTIIKLLPNL